jgi:predicted ATPase/class 3 adenylate cyclase
MEARVMDDIPSFGAWLRRRRKALDLTQEALAQLIGCSVVSIRKFEGDQQRPSRPMAERLASCLGLPSEERAAFIQAARAELAVDRLVTPISPIAQLAQLALPSGMVTFLFTDIEGSTPLWEREPVQMRLALARHDAILRTAMAAHAGHAYKTIGDAFQSAFVLPMQAVAAALAAQRAVAAQSWETSTPVRVRMGVHVGSAVAEGSDYSTTHALNRVARIMAAGHGGQILLSGEVADLVRRDLPADVTLRDMGTHHMKGLTHPEHLFQVVAPDVPAVFPPLTTLDTFHTNLPVQLTRFIGREGAITEVKGLLESTRLLTLTGSGGTGKTRLALEVGVAALQIFVDGVWLVELAALSDGAMVADTMAAILGMPQSNQPMLAVLMQYLRDKRVLLLLDNCEHLIQACAEVAEALLRACPNLRILATSREGLGLAGELTWPVPTLHMPDADAQLTPSELATFEAVRLFSDRAALVSPSFTLTAANAAAIRQICVRLDGIPLAIELAAARVKTLAIPDIAARLGDRFRLLTGGSRTALPRHQTLRALIDWSYRLLTEPERIVLRRLAVFAGGWTLEAAEAVCVGDDMDARYVLDELTRLVDKSLVVLDPRREDTRYSMLETIRQYLVERLEDAEESAAVRDRHLDYMLAFGERFAPKIRSSEILNDRFAPHPGEESVIDQAALVTRVAYDMDNIRRAVDWAAETGRIDEGLRVLVAFGPLFIVRVVQKELLARLRAMLEAQAPPRDAHAQTMACFWIAHVYQRQSEFDPGKVWLDKAETLIAQLDNPALQFSMLSLRMFDAQMRGDYGLAHSYLEQRQHLAITHDYFGIGKEAVEDDLGWDLALLLFAESDYRQALPRFQLIHAHAIKLGNMYKSTGMARGVGYALLYTGNIHEAAERFRESLVGNFALGDKQAVAACLAAWAALALKQEDCHRAARLFGASEALQEAISTWLMSLDVGQVQRNVATLRQILPAPELNTHWAAGRAMSMEQAIDDALTTYPFEQK